MSSRPVAKQSSARNSYAALAVEGGDDESQTESEGELVEAPVARVEGEDDHLEGGLQEDVVEACEGGGGGGGGGERGGEGGGDAQVEEGDAEVC